MRAAMDGGVAIGTAAGAAVGTVPGLAAAPAGTATRSSSNAREFDFVSAVDPRMWGEVESLFFFHPRQQGLLEPIRRSIDDFGAPEILRRGERIYLGIPRHDAQCLFACHRARHPQRPVGVVLYLRTQPDLLSVLHLAVQPNYENDGAYGELRLAHQLVGEVRSLARRIAGVRRIQLPYCNARFLPVGERAR
jgi:hypothetical protein